MSLVIPPLHRGTVYPTVTAYVCPLDGAPVIMDEWTHTVADHEGLPEEHTGLGFYCTNRECVHSTESLDEDELNGQFEEARQKAKADILSRFNIPQYRTNP